VKGSPSFSSRDKVTKRRRGKERVGWGRGPWRAVLAFFPGVPEFQVTPLFTASQKVSKFCPNFPPHSHSKSSDFKTEQHSE